MAHAIWSGAINFGLVTISVKLFTAVRANDLRFNFLHKKDDGRIFNERHCTVCGEKVEYADLVRGFHTVEHCVPSPNNRLGAKGAGEAGTTGALPTCMNAVVDALRSAGVAAFDMPATPARLWAALRAGRKSA